MAIRKDAKVELIRKVPLFAHCSKKELAQVAAIADEIDFPPGKKLIREGDRGREFFVLLEGTVDVQRGATKLATLKAGDFVGEFALVSRIPRTATVTTTSAVRALVITDRTFRSLLDDAPQIQIKVLEALAARLAQIMQTPTL